MAAGEEGAVFPLERIRQYAIEKNRTGVLHEYQLLGQPWLATKVLTPSRTYVFHENKPQVDHIFPLNLDGATEAYRIAVDILWNFQPLPAEVNNYKRARHPKEFFQSADGKKYWASYDFLPVVDSTLWDDHRSFLQERRSRMLGAMLSLYGIGIISEESSEPSTDAEAG